MDNFQRLSRLNEIYENNFSDSLQTAIDFNVHFKESIARESDLQGERLPSHSRLGLGKEDNETDRLSYVKKVSKDSIVNNKIDLDVEVYRALARNSFTAFNREELRVTTSANRAIKRIMGDFDITRGIDKTKDSTVLDERREDFDRYSASIAYNYLFKHETYKHGDSGPSLYGGLSMFDPYLSGSSTNVGLISSHQNLKDEKERAFERELDIGMGRATIANVLAAEEVSATSRVAELHDEFIRSDPSTLRRKMNGVYHNPQEAVKELSNRILSESSYIAKPGIRPAIALIESADKSLNIDLFQLQNQSVVDALVDKIRREAPRIARGEFSVNIALSGPSNPSSRSSNKVGLQILGPNIITMQRLFNLQQEILERAQTGEYEQSLAADREDYARSIVNRLNEGGYGPLREARSSSMNIESPARNRVRNVENSFKLRLVEGSYHPKLYSTERFAAIGSFNLTAPVGNSTAMAGSNFEELMIFQNRFNDLNQAQVGNTVRDIVNLKRKGNEKLLDILSDNEVETLEQLAETHLYHQTINIQQRGLTGSAVGAQIGNAKDTGIALKSTLDYLMQRPEAGKRRELYMNLNQLWLLQLSDDLYYGPGGDYSGEFGPSGRSKEDTAQAMLDQNKDSYRRMQNDLFGLISQDRAFITVDNRTYRDKILNPTYSKLENLLGRKTAIETGNLSNLNKQEINSLGRRQLASQYGGSIEGLVRKVKHKLIQTEGVINQQSLITALNKELGLTDSNINLHNVISDSVITKDQKNETRFSNLNKEAANRMSMQLLAIASGNIISSTETMQHVKNFFAVERDMVTQKFNILAAVMGSSNFGRSSSPIDDNTPNMSQEAGMILLQGKIREKANKMRKAINSSNSLTEEMEDMMLQLYAKRHAIPTWERLGGQKVGDVNKNSGKYASWESRVDSSGLINLTERLDQFNKDIGSSGISYDWIYGEGGNRIAIEVKLNVGSIGGLGKGFENVGLHTPKQSFRITNLKPIEGINDSGMVYFIGQNKLVSESIFVNNAIDEIKDLPYGYDPETGQSTYVPGKVLKRGDSIRLSPIDTTLNLFSTLLAEGLHRAYIEEPSNYLRNLASRSGETRDTTALGQAGVAYLEYLTEGRRSSDSKGSVNFLRSLDSTRAVYLAQSFTQRHLGRLEGPMARVLELTNPFLLEQLKETDPNNRQLDSEIKAREAVEGLILTIGKFNTEIKSKDISFQAQERNRLQQQRDELIGSLYKEMESLLTVNEKGISASPDIALGVIESRKDFMYQANLASVFKAVSMGLLEPFITQSQASTYGATQASSRLPIFGIARGQRKFVDKLTSATSSEAKGTVRSMYKYALGQGLVYSPLDSLGRDTESYIRGVAAGGSISEGVDDEGLSMYGLKKTPIGTIQDVSLSTVSGVGGIAKREEYEDSLNRILNNLDIGTQLTESQKLKQLQRAGFEVTPEGEILNDELLFYNFGPVKKASQISQRLKNVGGSRPMFEIDTEFARQMNSLGSPSSYIDNIYTKRRIQLLNKVLDSKLIPQKDKESIDLVLSELNIKARNSKVSSLNIDREIDSIIESNKKLRGTNREDIRSIIKAGLDVINTDITSSLKHTIPNASGFRTVMNKQLADNVNEFKGYLKTKYGFTEEDFSLQEGEEDISIARFLLLSHIRLADTMAAGNKGYLGTRDYVKTDSGIKKFKPSILVQLSGMYTDYGYGNPLYGSSPTLMRKYITEGWESLSSDEKAQVGTMSGFIEKREAKQKSSRLKADWVSGGVLIAREGDIVTYDTETNRVVVLTKDSLKSGASISTNSVLISSEEQKNSLLLAATGGTSLSKERGEYKINGIVDSRDMLPAIMGVIDNFKVFDNLPATSNIDRQTWHRDAEQSVEYVLDSKQLAGLPDTNQLIFDMTYMRARYMSGGGRVEAAGGLGKMVTIHTGYERMYSLQKLRDRYGSQNVAFALNRTSGQDVDAQSINEVDYFTYLITQFNLQVKDGSYKDDPLRLYETFGHANKSNLKSYFYSHGATIISNKHMIKGLTDYYGMNAESSPLGADPKAKEVVGGRLAAGLLLAFGTDWVDASSDTMNQIKAGLFNSAMKSELGSWYKSLVLETTVSALSNKSKLSKQIESQLGKKVNIAGYGQDSLRAVFQGLLSPSSESVLTKEQTDLRDAIAAVVGDSILAKAKEAFNPLQTPGLNILMDHLGAETLNRAIQGEIDAVEKLSKGIKQQIYREEFYKQEFAVLDSTEQRNAILLASALDMVSQLSQQDSPFELPTDVYLKDSSQVLQIASMMNLPDMERLSRHASRMKTGELIDSEDEEYYETVRSIILGTATRAPMIRMHVDFLASQSKEPLGTKYTGRLEYQHLLRPLLQNAKSFREEGKISGLRKVVANALASLSEWETATSIEGQMKDINHEVYDITDHRLASLKVKRDFLSIFAGASADSTSSLGETRYRLNNYINKVEDINKLIVDKLGDTSLDTESRISLISDLKDINTLMPDAYEGHATLYIDPMMGEKIANQDGSYKTVNNRLTDIFQRHLSDDSQRETLDKVLEDINSISYSKLIDISREYHLHDEKAFGIGLVKPILEQMTLGHKGMAFSLPSINVIGKDADGRTRVSMDSNSKIYSYLMSGPQLEAIGEQYGSFVDPIISTTVYLASAFAPGTRLNSIIQRMRMSSDAGQNEVSFTGEEMQLLQDYYKNANSMIDTLAEVGTGSRHQMALGIKSSMPGVVSVAAGSFQVPAGFMVMAEESFKQYGTGAINKNRYNELLKTEAMIARNSLQPYDPSQASFDKLDERYYTSYREALLGGMSETATKSLNNQTQRVLDSLSSKGEIQREALDEQIREYRRLHKQAKNNPNTRGDSFLYVNTEMELINYRLKSFGSDALEEITKEKDPKEVRLIERLTSTSGADSIQNREGTEMLNVALFENALRKKAPLYRFDKKTLFQNLKGYREKFQLISAEADGIKASLENYKSYLENKYPYARLDESQKALVDSNRQFLSNLSQVMSIVGRGTKEGYSERDVKELNTLFQIKVEGYDGEQGLGAEVAKALRPDESIDRSTAQKAVTNASILVMERAMTLYDTRSSLETLTFRSPPFGGTEQQRQVVETLGGVIALNKFVSDQMGSNTITGLSSLGTVPLINYNEDRNKALSLLNPLTFLTNNLGDFDGDPYTSIFSQISDEYDKVRSNQSTLMGIDRQIQVIQQQLRGDPQDQELLKSSLDKFIQKKNQIISNTAAIEENIKNFNRQFNDLSYTKAVKKEVANYLGVSGKYFMTRSEGGYLTDDTPMDLGTVFTYLEQGKGLFGGIENIGEGINEAREFMTYIFGSDEMMESYRDERGLPKVQRVSLPSEREGMASLLQTMFEGTSPLDTNNQARLSNMNTLQSQLQERLNFLIDNEVDNKRQWAYIALSASEDAQRNLIKEVQAELRAVDTTTNAIEGSNQSINEEFLMAYMTSAFNSRREGLKTMQGLLTQGAGVSMESSAYGAMIKTMGKAGGDVLGKTYNTLIGTLYSDSPLMALAHVFKDEEVYSAFKTWSQENNIGIDPENFIKTLDEASAQAEGLQGFMKDINQLLRDGIKPKGGTALLEQMKSLSVEYGKLTEMGDSDSLAKRDQLVTDMAAEFGPSGSAVGMGALMELNELINKREILQSTTFSASRIGAEESTIVFSELFPSDGQDGQLISGILNKGLRMQEGEFERLAREISIREGKDNLSVFDVAAYKVARDMQTLVVGYRYSTSVVGAGLEPGEGESYLNHIYKGTLDRAQSSSEQAKIFGFREGTDLSSITSRQIDESIALKMGTDSQYRDILGRYLGGDELVDEYLGLKRQGDNNPFYDSAQGDALKRERAAMFEIISMTVEQTSSFLGHRGENLRSFTQMQGIRQDATGMVQGRKDRMDNKMSDLVASDIFTTLMNLSSAGKLTAHGSQALFETFQSYSGMLNAAAGSSEAILMQTLTGVADSKDGGMIFQNWTSLNDEEGRNFRLQMRKVLGAEGEFQLEGSDAKHKTLLDFIAKRLEATSLNMRSKMLGEFFTRASQGPNTPYGNPVEDLEFMLGVDPSQLQGEELEAFNTSKIQYQKALQEWKTVTMRSRRQPQGINGFKPYQGLSAEVTNDYVRRITMEGETRAQGLSMMQDLMIPFAITAIGSAVLGGRLTSEAVGDAIGGTLVAASTMRNSIMATNVRSRWDGKSERGLSKTVGAITTLVGQSSKFNLAMQEAEGDYAKAVGIHIAREAAFTVGVRLLAPAIETGVTNVMMHSAKKASSQRAAYEAATSSLDNMTAKRKRDFLLKAGGFLDTDEYTKSRGTASFISGAILSGVLGIAMSNIGGHMAASMMDNGDLSEFDVVDALIGDLSSQRQKVNQQAAERSTHVNLQNEEGQPIDYVAIDPIEEMQHSAIQDIYMTPEYLEHYTHADTYGFISTPT